jgi:glycosyltransferase involved in cell wall biosynthesis
MFSRATLTESEQPGLHWRRMLKRRLWQKLSDSKPDVIAVPGWSAPEALSALEWCVRYGRPAVLMSESARQDEIRRPWKEWLKRKVVRLCSTALVGGRVHLEYLAELGMPRERIFLGYDAVDNDYFANHGKVTGTAQPQPRSAGFSLQKETNLPPEQSSPAESRPCPSQGAAVACCRLKPALRNYFLASARFVAKKNLPRLIEAFAGYRKGLTGGNRENGEDRGWDLVLLGDGEMRPELEAQVAALKLGDNVLMPGFKQYEELPLYYATAGAFIHASTTEQWGLVVNEAMVSGLPVLVSNRCGCAPDLVKEGINGFTFDPFNIQQLSELMRRVAEMEPARRAEMGASSRELIAHWGTERFATGLQQAVQTAVGLPRPRAKLLERLLLRALAFR